MNICFENYFKLEKKLETIKCMIVSQASLDFDPVKKRLKILCHIYILTKKVIILRKLSVTMKFFAPPLSTIERNYSRFSCWFITYRIRIGILNKCKFGHCENEARELDCFCWNVDAMLIALAKIPDRERSILSIQLLSKFARLLVTRISLIYPVDKEFFFWLLM